MLVSTRRWRQCASGGWCGRAGRQGRHAGGAGGCGAFGGLGPQGQAAAQAGVGVASPRGGTGDAAVVPRCGGAVAAGGHCQENTA